MSLRHSVFLAIAGPVLAQAPAARKFEPKLLLDDFRIARAALEEGHSGIYRYTPKTVLDGIFDKAAASLDHPMTAVEFARVLAPVVMSIKCGHTDVDLPVEEQRTLSQKSPLFPFDVELLGGKFYVYREYHGGPEHYAGLEVVRINGVAIVDILRTMIAATPGDADSKTVRPYRIGHGRGFAPLLYAALGIESPFEIDFRDPASGKTSTAKVAGVPLATRPKQPRPDGTAALKFLDDGKVAVLTIRAFGGKAGPEKKPLGKYFDDVFQKIHSHNSSALILDVRNNGGGEDDLGKKLLSFLLDAPFQYYDDLIVNKREFDFFRYSKDARPIPAGDVKKGADGKFHAVSHPNWGIQQPRQPHFAGRVLVVMNGGSFSTTCEFLSNLHYRHRATFLGEEAGGGYYGNTSGYGATVTLPNTKVQIEIPLLTYYLAVKDAPNPMGSIPPDVPIEPSIVDLLGGNDTQMTKAIDLARQR